MQMHISHLICHPLVFLQPDVRPQASLVAGASPEARGFRGPAQERAVGSADRADQSAPLPAG